MSASCENPISETSGALALLLVAVVAAAYHALVLRGDQALRAETVAEAVAETAGGVASPARRMLVLTGPTNADLDATVAAMRAALPPELSLETNPTDD